jgi:hydrogenase expression/formation protein HypC
MCLGVPGQITETWQHETTGLAMGKVSFSGIGKEVCLSCVPDAEVGDYVVVHVGFAISKVDEEEAKQVFSYLEAMDDLAELEIAQPETT